MKLLALECSTERWSIAIGAHGQCFIEAGAGGPELSEKLIPSIESLLRQARVSLRELEAIVVSHGPGAFTGVRSACAVAQGLAFGANLPVLPVDSLLALAEQTRTEHQTNEVVAFLDARMDQLYCAAYRYQGQAWQTEAAPSLCAPEQLALPGPSWALAGNALDSYGPRLPQAASTHHAWPQAQALLNLAPHLLALGLAMAPAQLAPLYVRDKVALTSAERARP